MSARQLLFCLIFLTLSVFSFADEKEPEAKFMETGINLEFSPGNVLSGFYPGLNLVNFLTFHPVDWLSAYTKNESAWDMTEKSLSGTFSVGCGFFDLASLQIDMSYPSEIAFQLVPALEYTFELSKSDFLSLGCKAVFIIYPTQEFSGFEIGAGYEHSFDTLSLYVSLNMPYDYLSGTWSLKPIIGIEMEL